MQAYLNIEEIVQVAKEQGVTYIHPGKSTYMRKAGENTGES